jgi:glycosyltransferase involved in cell wall biosynthesis
MLPTITIVTPSYNQGSYLEEAISSVLSQGYPRLQYMVIDGGSTDSSRDVLTRYSGKLDYWISEKDRGQSDALRKGFSRATGELLGWINSDDILYPGALRQVGKAYEASPGSIVAGNVAVFSKSKPGESKVIRQRHLNVRDMVAIWTGRRRYSQPGVFFPREAYQRSGGIDEDLHLCMDLDLMVRMLRNCPVAYIHQIVAGARLHPQSKTCSQAGAQIAEAYQVSRRYWNELPYPAVFCRLFSFLGLGRCALGRLRHGNPEALGSIFRQMMSVAAKRQ